MPSGVIHRHKKGNFRKTLRYAPLTLSTLAALIPQDIKAEVRIIDEGVEFLDKNFDADLIAINAITGTSLRAYKIADYARKKGIKVVLGGVHPSLMPDEAAEHADSVILGFAEKTWPRLLRDFAQNKLQKFYFQPECPSLEGIPIPRRDLLKGSRYVTVNTIYATRSCPNACEFCVIPVVWGQRLYCRPINEVISEIERLEGRDLIFIDPNLTADIDYARELFTRLIPLKKTWLGLATSKVTEDKKTFDLMVKSGCKGLFIGFESVSQIVLNNINKDFNTVNKYKEIVKEIHDNGIAIQGAFVFGFDYDDTSVFEQTIDYINSLNIDLPRFSVFTPFPNTPIYKNLMSENRILEKSWSLYDCQHVVFKPKKMSANELQDGLNWAWKQAYTLKSTFKRLSYPGCSPLIPILCNLGYSYYAKKLARYNKEFIIKDDSEDL
jgi:radical SAM superfamily enzyme YgiQ (UPF0313 family)